MKLYKELTYILGFSFIGHIISTMLKLPIPSSIIGLLLFFIALKTKIIKIEKVEKTSNFFIESLPILFVPAGVKIITVFHHIENIWFKIFLVCLITTIISLIVVGIFMEFLIKRRENDTSNN